jgi:hypothetical protein
LAARPAGYRYVTHPFSTLTSINDDFIGGDTNGERAGQFTLMR